MPSCPSRPSSGLIEADANRQRGVEGPAGLPPEAASRAISEYMAVLDDAAFVGATEVTPKFLRSEEHTSELQSLMRNSYDVIRLQKQESQQHQYAKRGSEL